MFGHNKGASLFSQSSEGLLGGNSGPRMLNLVAASQGFTGNGMATIGLDNTFSVIAHLPPPHTFSPYSPAVYAAYLVDSKGKSGFYAGTLRAAGNGMYQCSFKSPVPLIHYNRVSISLESPQNIGQAPQGPIVMKVKEGIMDSFGPVKKIGGDMWGKVKGFVGSRFGRGEEVPEEPMDQGQSGQQFSQQPPNQGYQKQQGYYQPGPPPQGGYQQGSVPGNQGYQVNKGYQGYQANQGFQPVQGYQGSQPGGYKHNNYPQGRGLYSSPETYKAQYAPAPPVNTMPNPPQQVPIPTSDENLE